MKYLNIMVLMNHQYLGYHIVNIKKLYSIQDYNIIYNTLVLLEKNPQNYNEYINGINSILNPINSQIKKWINDNIVF